MQEAWSGGLPLAQGRTSRGDFATGAVFSLANPFALAFWSGIGSGLTSAGARPGAFVTLFAGFVLGALLWCLFIPCVIGWGRRFVRPVVFRAAQRPLRGGPVLLQPVAAVEHTAQRPGSSRRRDAASGA